MRWASSDYVNDPWVKLAAARGDAEALAFYPLFLFHSQIQGGYLPSDPERLAAALGVPLAWVEKALPYWSSPDCGLVRLKGAQAWNPRVLREVKEELAFRAAQSEHGKKGGLAHGKGRPKASPNPPAPAPFPAPAPVPAPAPAPAAAPAPEGAAGEPPEDVAEAPGEPLPLTRAHASTRPRRTTDNGAREGDAGTTPSTCPRCKAVGKLRQRVGAGGAATGWFCGPRLGGCDAKFALDDAEILGQLSVEVASRYAAAAHPEAAARLAAEHEAERLRAEVRAVLAECEPGAEVWDAALEVLQANMSLRLQPHTFATWFRPTTCLGIRYDTDGSRQLFVQVPNGQFLEWLATNHGPRIYAALEAAGHKGLAVFLATDDTIRPVVR